MIIIIWLDLCYSLDVQAWKSLIIYFALILRRLYEE